MRNQYFENFAIFNLDNFASEARSLISDLSLETNDAKQLTSFASAQMPPPACTTTTMSKIISCAYFVNIYVTFIWCTQIILIILLKYGLKLWKWILSMGSHTRIAAYHMVCKCVTYTGKEYLGQILEKPPLSG